MRNFLALIVVVLLALASGVALAVIEYGGLPRPGLELAGATSLELRAAQATAAINAPRALVNSVDFDFGTMERGTTRSHEFPIKNDGRSPLLLEQADTSCSCTLSGLDTNSLAPGQTAHVKLTWTGNNVLSTFRHWAKIRTNDPSAPEIEFAIHGQVVESIEVQPELIRFDKPADTEWSTQASVLSHVMGDLQLTGYELEDPATAPQFAVELEPVTPSDSDIKSQWSVKVTVKPGLPSGRIQQKIRLRTNFTDKPEIEITVTGTIESAIRVLGSRWNSTNGVLTLGQLDAGKEGIGELKILAQGEHRDRIKLKVKQVTPSFLQVEIGEPQPLAAGERIQIPVKITVPADAPFSNYVGTAEVPYALVTLETGDPEQTELEIKVGFAVSK